MEFHTTSAMYKNPPLSGRESAQLVYLALGYCADDKTQECWPPQPTLTNMTGLCRKAVMTAIQRLLDLGLIRISRKPGKKNLHIVPRPKAEKDKSFAE